jgi:carboxyl-terminal processing protease
MRKILLIGISTFALGAAAMAYADQQSRTPKAETYKMLELFGDVLATVEDQYVVPVDDKKLIQAAIDGMLTSLDPHSGYLDSENFDEMRDQTRGEYGGLGLVVQSEDGAVKVVSPMDGTPAGRAGILAGDYITAIDGQSVVGLPLDAAVKQMRGPIGTSITLTVAREKQNPFSVKLAREIINVKSVTAKVEGDYGYIRLSGFDEKTGEETRAAIKDLKTKIPHMKGMVLDLRNNPGGLVDQAVEVASAFLDGGEVVSQRGRDARDIERYNARAGGDMLNGLPLVVVINNGSASASEIVAGALKDRRRAEVIGLTSFGKGSVQTVIPLRGGMDGALKLTTARYFTPSGQSIQKTGIAPDLEVASSKEEAERVADSALQFSEASFRNALDAEAGKVRREAHAPTEIPPEGYDSKKDDFQLARALDVLRTGSVEAAVRLKPAKTYAMATPAFMVGAAASATPAATTDAKPTTPSKVAPADEIKPAAPKAPAAAPAKK